MASNFLANLFKAEIKYQGLKAAWKQQDRTMLDKYKAGIDAAKVVQDANALKNLAIQIDRDRLIEETRHNTATEANTADLNLAKTETSDTKNAFTTMYHYMKDVPNFGAYYGQFKTQYQIQNPGVILTPTDEIALMHELAGKLNVTGHTVNTKLGTYTKYTQVDPFTGEEKVVKTQGIVSTPGMAETPYQEAQIDLGKQKVDLARDALNLAIEKNNAYQKNQPNAPESKRQARLVQYNTLIMRTLAGDPAYMMAGIDGDMVTQNKMLENTRRMLGDEVYNEMWGKPKAPPKAPPKTVVVNPPKNNKKLKKLPPVEMPKGYNPTTGKIPAPPLKGKKK